MKLVGLELDPKTQIGSCSVAQKQLIELAKVISDNVKVLIMDEPTSALNDVETEHLFQFIHSFFASGGHYTAAAQETKRPERSTECSGSGSIMRRSR